MEVRVAWMEMEGEVFRLSQRMRYRIPSTPVGRSEFLLRAPPSDSKVCVGALSLARHAKSYMSCRWSSQGFGTCRLAGGLACGLPVPAYCAGVLVACLVATARVQREQRPGGQGAARPSWLPTLSVSAVPWPRMERTRL